MVGKYTKGKAYCFIDVANLFYAQRTLKWKVSYRKFKEYLGNECNLGEVFVYTAYDEKNRRQKKFFRMLDSNKFVIRAKSIKKFVEDGKWKGNFDVELTIDVMDNLKNFDTFILVSGDSDFAPLVDRVKRDKKNVLVLSTRGHIAKELTERAKYVDIIRLQDFVELDIQKIRPRHKARGSSSKHN